MLYKTLLTEQVYMGPKASFLALGHDPLLS